MKNWKTTLIGAAMASALIVLGLIQTGTVSLKDALIAGAIALIGSFAKDFNVTGGSKAQTPEAESRATDAKVK